MDFCVVFCGEGADGKSALEMRDACIEILNLECALGHMNGIQIENKKCLYKSAMLNLSMSANYKYNTIQYNTIHFYCTHLLKYYKICKAN
jgi:hypothetical protein